MISKHQSCLYLVHVGVAELEDVDLAEPDEYAVPQHCGLVHAPLLYVDLSVWAGGRYCHNALCMGHHAVTRLDVRSK